jgi:hypothetical protein
MQAVRQRQALNYLKAREFEWRSAQAPPPNWVTRVFQSYVDRDAFVQISQVTRWGTDDITNEDVTALTRIQGLDSLTLMRGPPLKGQYQYAQNHVTIDQFHRISQIKTLASIYIQGQADPKTQNELAKLPLLHSLQIPCTAVSDEALIALSKNRKLASLEFEASQVTSVGLEALRQLPELQSLSLIQLRDGPSNFPAIVDCKALTHLRLYRMRLMASDASILCELPMQSLDIFDCVIEPGFFLALANSRTTKRLYLRSTLCGFEKLDLSLASFQFCEDHFTMPKENSATRDPGNP